MIEKKITLESLDIKIDASVERLDREIRKIGVLLERLEGKFDTLYESHLAHDEQLRGFHRKIESGEVRTDDLERLVKESIEFNVQQLYKKLDKEEFAAFKRRLKAAN